MVILDASVVVKWFIEEEESNKARKLMWWHIKGDVILVAPDLLIYEVSNVLKASGAFSEEDIHEGIQDLYNLKIDIVAPLPNVVHPAIRLMCEKAISFYDAFYVALAQELQLRLITADKKLCQKVKDLPFVQLLTELEI